LEWISKAGLHKQSLSVIRVQIFCIVFFVKREERGKRVCWTGIKSGNKTKKTETFSTLKKVSVRELKRSLSIYSTRQDPFPKYNCMAFYTMIQIVVVYLFPFMVLFCLETFFVAVGLKTVKSWLIFNHKLYKSCKIRIRFYILKTRILSRKLIIIFEQS